MEPELPGVAFFCLEPEPTQFGRSRPRTSGAGSAQKSDGSATLFMMKKALSKKLDGNL